MKRITYWGFLALVCCLFAAPVHCLASDGMQPVVVVTDRLGSSNFSMSNGDGSLTAQQALVRHTGPASPEDYTYSNGIGDFDNDGALDVIIAVGSDSGIVYRFGNIGDNGAFPQGEFIGPNRGSHPAKMAVADFNGDSKLDFIMTYDGSADCDLFKGNGNMEFTHTKLTGTAPEFSIGADAGDFNGDGNVDFVVTSYNSPSVYINLGNGDGTFDTENKNLLYLFGSVAAADFNGDGMDDLALSYFGGYYIMIYINDRDHFIANDTLNFYEVFPWVVDYFLNNSPIDAWDFDGDEKPDLVVGSYRSTRGPYTDIAVMRGKGEGEFEAAVPYGGAPEGLVENSITAISAPTPFQTENLNAAPVAVISYNPSEVSTARTAEVSTAQSAEVSTGQTVHVDGGGSYDDDGQIVSYLWDFGDGTLIDGLAAEHVYYEAGEYVVRLTVIDDLGAEGSAELLVKVSALSARMRIFPRFLNLESRARWMHAGVKLPEGCDATQVDVDAIFVIDGEPQPRSVDLTKANSSLAVKTNRWLAKRNRLYLKFDRQATIDAIGTSSDSDQATIRINGVAVCNGGYAEFSADDTIRTVKRDKKKKRYNWQRRFRRGSMKKR